jgi:hypothetical protein
METEIVAAGVEVGDGVGEGRSGVGEGVGVAGSVPARVREPSPR